MNAPARGRRDDGQHPDDPTGAKRRNVESGGAEHEFGVPFPGVVAPPAQWAKTALKKLPPPGDTDWAALFGRAAPLIVDVGCGNGRFVLGSAWARPECNHLGVDILPLVLRYGTRRANQRGLIHVRFAAIGGRELLADHVRPGELAELHCYHPQPHHDPRDAGKRLLTPEFLALAHRALAPGGLLVLQTDEPAYWRYLRGIVGEFFNLEERHAPWPEAPRGRTRREIQARREGLPIFRGEARPRGDIDAAAAAARAAELPGPTFRTSRERR